MKKIPIAILAILLLSGLSVEAPAATQPHPKAVVPEVVYTFPPVVEGKEVTRSFTIANEGDAPLIIERVGTG